MNARTGRVLAVVVRQAYLMRGSPARVLPLFAWVAIDVVLWGLITRYLGGLTGTGPRLVTSLLGAVLFWDFFIRVMQGVTLAFFEDVWSRSFKNVFASPITVAEYASGLVVSSIATSAVGLAVMVVLAGAVFGLQLLAYGAMAVPFVLVLFVFGIALGLFACALVLRLGPASEWLVWPIPALLSPFAGVFYPVSTLPAWMRAVARALPPSYVFEALRGLVAGRTPAAGPLLGALALASAYLVVGGFTFARVHRAAVVSGLLARYSAESVT